MLDKGEMLDKFEGYLRDLALIPGLSGHEQRVAAYMERAFRASGFQTGIDTFGNCIAKMEGSDPDAPVMMVFAHMDSLGFVVRHVEDDGFIRFERLGGIPEKVLPAAGVQIIRRDGTAVDGVIGTKPHHITPPEEKYIVEKYQNLFIDIGAESRQQVLDAGVDVGSPVVYKPEYRRLLGYRAAGTFMDNRKGCASLLTLAGELSGVRPRSDLYLVGTVQEEYNLRGAMMAARTVKPDLAICVDGGISSDIPNLPHGPARLGGGPVLCYYNFHGRGTLNGTIPHPAMVRLMEQSAVRAGVTYQKSVMVGGLTDASYLQLEQSGVKCVDIGAPQRYSHSPSEVADLRDSAALVKWVKEAVCSDLASFDWSRNW